MSGLPVLETKRLVLTLPGPQAASRLAEYAERNADRLRASSPTLPEGFFTEHYWRERLVQELVEFDADCSLRLVAFERGNADGDVVALCGFTQFVRGPLQKCVLGYSVDRIREGQGMMREALEAALPYVFDVLKFHRIEANYRPVNERSGSLLRRLGFVVEGYARDYLLLDGAWEDHILTSLTKRG